MSTGERMSSLVSVCVCTCKRPQGLARLLETLKRLQLPPGLDVELVVVDNDPEGSGQAIAGPALAAWPWPARYCIEFQPGVSFARNRCFAEAGGAWIAFVDDDEWVEADWLLHLVEAAQNSACDAVIAPVQSVFEVPPPAWIEKSGAFSRAAFVTGELIDWRHCASGNALIKRELHARVGGFDVAFGASGGEDTDFFIRCATSGARTIWCEEALVHEGVPAYRMTTDWVLRRCMANGRNYARIVARHLGWAQAIDTWLRGATAVLVFGLLAAVGRALGRVDAMRYERRAAMGYGKMTPWRGSRQGLYGDAGVRRNAPPVNK